MNRRSFVKQTANAMLAVFLSKSSSNVSAKHKSLKGDVDTPGQSDLILEHSEWHPESYQKLKNNLIIEVVFDLMNNKSIYGVDIADFFTFFRGIDSKNIHVTPWSSISNSFTPDEIFTSSQLEYANSYSIIPSRTILHISTGSGVNNEIVNKIIHCIKSKLNDDCLFQVMLIWSDTLPAGKTQAFIIYA